MFKEKIKQNIYLLILLTLALIPLRDLFNSGLFVGHDTVDHVARIANFYQNLQDGNIIPRWAPNLNWGYGHPILMFLYPLPSYIASFFHFLGFSLVASTEIVFGLGFVLSGVAIFLWIKELWGEKSAFISGMLYMFAPYRFVDLYVRGAIGENFFFIWPPLILYFLTKLSREQKWKYVIGGSLSLAAMLLSHNALSIMYLPFILIYGYMAICLNGSSFREKLSIVKGQMSIVILGFGLSASFWLPAFFEGKYTLRDIVTGEEIFSRFETFRRLLYSPWNYGGTGQFSVQIGIIQWILIAITPVLIFAIWRKSKKSKLPVTSYQLLATSFMFFLISIFLILPISKPIYQTLTILQKFQFPWRWLSLSIFPPAIFGGVLIYILPKKYKLITLYSLLATSILLTRSYWQAKDYSHKKDSFYSGIYNGTTDTGESAPIWSVRFMLEEPKAHMEVIDGEAEIDEIQRKSTVHRYKLNVKSEKVRILENTLYFPGWFVYIDGGQVPLYDLNWQDPAHRGLMTFYVPQGEHEVLVKFTETKLRLFADIITATSIIFLGIFFTMETFFND